MPEKSATKSVVVNLQRRSSRGGESRNTLHRLSSSQRRGSSFSRQCEDVKLELCLLASFNNLLLIMVYSLILIMFFCVNLQDATGISTAEVQCEIHKLAKTKWTFYQKRNITCGGADAQKHNIGCFYYDYNYSFLAILPYEAALEEVRSTFITPKTIPCQKYLYKDPIPKPLSLMRQFDLLCERQCFQSFHFFVQLGSILGGLPSGIAADIYGRKPVFIFGAVVIIIGSCFIPVASNFKIFLTGRVVTCAGISIVIQSLFIIFIELCHNKYRSSLLVLSYVALYAGTIVVDVAFPDIPTWKLQELAKSCPFLIILFGIMFVPESPRWLMVRARWKMAWAVLREMGSPEKPVLVNEDNPFPPNSISQQLSIFHKTYFQYRTSIIIIIVGIAPIMNYIVVSLKQQEVAQEVNVDKPMAAVLVITIILTSGAVFTFSIKSVCCNLFLLLACSLIASVLKDTKTVNDATLILAEIFSAALLPVVVVYILELFPTTHRATIIGLGSSISGIGALIYLYYQLELPHKENIQIIRGFFCSLCLLCTLVTAIGPQTHQELPDTKEDLIYSLTIAEQISSRF